MALRPPPQPPSQAVYTEKPPAPQAAGPGLFAGSRFSRKRQGTSARGAPPAKRPSEAAVTQHDTQNPVDLLQRAARIMGFSLHAGPAGPVGRENPGVFPWTPALQARSGGKARGFSLDAGPAGPVGGENPGFFPGRGFLPAQKTLDAGPAGPVGGENPGFFPGRRPCRPGRGGKPGVFPWTRVPTRPWTLP